MCKMCLEICAVSCNLNAKDVQCFAIQVTLVWTLFFFFLWETSVTAGPVSTVLKTRQLLQLLRG